MSNNIICLFFYNYFWHQVFQTSLQLAQCLLFSNINLGPHVEAMTVGHLHAHFVENWIISFQYLRKQHTLANIAPKMKIL